MVARGLAVSFDSGAAPHLRASSAGCAPSRGESHLLSPSDGRPWSLAQQKLMVRQRPHSADLSVTCQRLRETWSRVEGERGDGNSSPRFEFASGAPLRFAAAGVGGGRFLVVTPCPRSWQPCSEANRDTASALGVPVDLFDVGLHEGATAGATC